MEYALLRSLRALGPGLLILLYIDLFMLCVLHGESYFWPMDSAKLFLVGYAVGGVYGVLTSRLKRDRYAFAGVNESTFSALRAFAPEMEGRSWNDISPCFYTLIDNDKSLEQKSKGMYFNGFIVTTSFDTMWLSLVATCIGSVVGICKDQWAYLGASASISVLAYLIWQASNRRHRELAIEQVNVIKKRFDKKFRTCVSAGPPGKNSSD